MSFQFSKFGGTLTGGGASGGGTFDESVLDGYYLTDGSRSMSGDINLSNNSLLNSSATEYKIRADDDIPLAGSVSIYAKDDSGVAKIYYNDGSTIGELGGGGTLQDTYDNSDTQPQIITDNTNQAIVIQNGQTDDSKNQLEIKNLANEKVIIMDANGTLRAKSVYATDYYQNDKKGILLTQTNDSNYHVGDGSGDLLTTGVNNIFIGDGAGALTTTRSNNVGIGKNALNISTGGLGNVAIGSSALNELTEGDQNTAIGQNSGNALTAGTRNVFIGVDSQTADPNVNYGIALGYGSRLLSNNSMVIGSEDQPTTINSIIPGVSMECELGSATKAWADIYSGGLRVYSPDAAGDAAAVISVTNSSNFVGLQVKGNGNLSKCGNIIPHTSSEKDIGTNSERYRRLYSNILDLIPKPTGANNDQLITIKDTDNNLSFTVLANGKTNVRGDLIASGSLIDIKDADNTLASGSASGDLNFKDNAGSIMASVSFDGDSLDITSNGSDGIRIDASKLVPISNVSASLGDATRRFSDGYFGSNIHMAGTLYISNRADAPAAPGIGECRVYTKQDNNLYLIGNDGVERLVGDGGGGSVDLSSYVQGPASATDDFIPQFSGTSGKVIKLSGVKIDDHDNLVSSGIQAKTAKTNYTENFGLINIVNEDFVANEKSYHGAYRLAQTQMTSTQGLALMHLGGTNVCGHLQYNISESGLTKSFTDNFTVNFKFRFIDTPTNFAGLRHVTFYLGNDDLSGDNDIRFSDITDGLSVRLSEAPGSRGTLFPLKAELMVDGETQSSSLFSITPSVFIMTITITDGTNYKVSLGVDGGSTVQLIDHTTAGYINLTNRSYFGVVSGIHEAFSQANTIGIRGIYLREFDIYTRVGDETNAARIEMPFTSEVGADENLDITYRDKVLSINPYGNIHLHKQFIRPSFVLERPSYTVSDNDCIILVATQSIGEPCYIRLPEPSDINTYSNHMEIVVKDRDGQADNNPIVIETDGTGYFIDGNASLTISDQYNSVTLFCDGIRWLVL
jgi:hypothetical protein